MTPWIPSADTPPPWDALGLAALVGRAGIDPARPAIVLDGEVRTHGELADRASRVAGGLVDLGVCPGDRVAISARNRLEYLEVEIAVAAAGAVLVPTSWRYAATERADVLRRSGARVLVGDDDAVAGAVRGRAAGELPDLGTVVGLDARPADVGYAELTGAPRPPDDTLPATRLTDPHEIIYTSGTTGRPKGAVWTQGTVLWNALQQAVDFAIRPESSTYVGLDLNYIGGRHQFTWALLVQGGTVHLRRSGGFDPRQVVAYVAEHRISHVLWVPTMLYDILATGDVASHDTRHLEMIMCGGAPLSESVVRRAQEAFPHTRVVQVYGLTEGGGTVSFVPPRHLRRKPGSAGRASLHNDIRIAPDGDGRPAAPGVTGEVLVRGPAMMSGYWDDPEATADAVVGGWLHTGDLGHLDEEGFLYISGRRKELVISGGMNVFPAEVEDVLRTHPAVRDAAVIGLPDERWGELVCAVVQPVDDATVTAEELVAHCRGRLAGFKKPTRVLLTAHLPRTLSGKVRKAELRDAVIRGEPDGPAAP